MGEKGVRGEGDSRSAVPYYTVEQRLAFLQVAEQPRIE